MADKPFILSSLHLAPSGTFEPPFLIWPTSDGPLRFLGLVARSRSPSPEPSPRRLEAYKNLFGESPARFVETQQALLAPETPSDSIFTLYEEDGAQVPADEAASGSMAMVGSSQLAVDDEPNHDVQGEAMQYYEEASAIAPLLQPMMQGYPEHASATPYPADASAESPGPSYTMHYIGIAQGALGILSRKQVSAAQLMLWGR